MNLVPRKLHMHMLQVWDQIAGDLLQAIEQEGLEPIVPKDEVIEVVLDADRLSTFAGTFFQQNVDTELISEIEEFNKLPYKRRIELARTVFRYDSYGW